MILAYYYYVTFFSQVNVFFRLGEVSSVVIVKRIESYIFCVNYKQYKKYIYPLPSLQIYFDTTYHEIENLKWKKSSNYLCL